MANNYYKQTIANVLGIDRRTPVKRLKTEGVYESFPALQVHKGVLTEDDLALIRKTIAGYNRL